MSLPETECPICGREWVPTMFDDYCLPACGCFGDVFDRNTPCEPCGISHAWNCPKLPGHEDRVAQTTEPRLIEIGPLGEVHKGTVKGAE